MNKMTSRQKIDAAHETRMWIKDVVIPASLALVFIDTLNPQLKYDAKQKIDETKQKIKDKFNKK